MTPPDVTVTGLHPLPADAASAEVSFEMDEETFRAFYERTARSVWRYLARLSGDAQCADDLLQETYYRFLRARVAWQSESHRRAYLFRIATNLAHDRRRRGLTTSTVSLGEREVLSDADPAAADRRADFDKAMRQLRPRDRALLWLAYGVGQPHAEIAATIGVRAGSVKLLLFRARRRLAALLGRPYPHGRCHDPR